MAQMLPYILPLLLGRTFDMDKMQVGVDIFSKDTLDRKLVLQNPSTETHYKIVDNSVEARNLLDVGGSFSLNVKAGVFKAGASGEYLADTYNRENTVELAVRAMYQTVTEQLPHDAKPVDTWKTQGSALGTHFVRSITYGGELIASVRLDCNSTKDKKKIKGALDVGGRMEIFDFGIEAEGEFIKDVAKSVESTQIKIFSSIPLSKPPNDMESLKNALDTFPNDMKQFNGGRGIPLKMELWPLSLLDSTRPDHMRNRVLEATLEGFEQKFDDLLNTKSAVANWMKTLIKPMTDEQEIEIGDMYESVEKTIKKFYEAIGSLDMSKGSDQLREAETAYGNGISGVFYRKYLLLRHKITKDQGDWSLSRGSGISYVHWGKRNCSDVAEQMSDGLVVGPESSGGGNFLCFPKSTTSETLPANQNDAAIVKETPYQYPGQDPSQIFCSTCRLGSKGTVQVFSGRSSCPDDWDYIYDGLLMSGSEGRMSTLFVCLDRNAEKNAAIVTAHPIIPNWTSLLKKGSEQEETRILFSCVVCAK